MLVQTANVCVLMASPSFWDKPQCANFRLVRTPNRGTRGEYRLTFCKPKRLSMPDTTLVDFSQLISGQI